MNIQWPWTQISDQIEHLYFGGPSPQLVSLACVLLVATLACEPPPQDEADESNSAVDAGDHDADDVDDGDTDSGDDTNADEEMSAVEVALADHFDAPGDGFVRAAQVSDDEELIDGPVAQGQQGDWLLENDHGRYLVGLGDRAIGPCSWDGNVIETEAILDGEATGSVLGEICLLINVGQTFKPASAEIIEDGSSGRAIVAVTGTVAPLDFLNVRNMLDDMAPGFYDFLHLDPERSPPLTITVYYGLTPESESLRVVTAFRNDGDDDEYFNAAHMVLSGSTGSFFNPLSSRRGWGFESLGMDNMDADPVSFVGYFARDGGYAFVPDVQEHLSAGLPAGGGMVGISGVVAVIHGATNLMDIISATETQIPETEGYLGLAPGQTTTVGYRLYPSDGSPSTVTDHIYGDLGVDTTRVSGQIVDTNGQGLGGVMVTPLRDGERAYSMAWTDDEGHFAMALPEGNWELRARDEGSLLRHADLAIGDADGDEEIALGELELAAAGEVTVQIRSPEGDPVPGRVVIECVGPCGDRRLDSRERDPKFLAPLGWLKLVEVGVEGQTEIALPEGDYRISVNRGMTWSTWPADAVSQGGQLLSVNAGDEQLIEAEIAPVVDTSGMLGADFHVHAMASPDSSAGNRQRVLDFLAGGLDVMVSSDHDAVSDFEPTIAALDAGDQIASVVGSEITTSNLGHINAFPLDYDGSARRGGTIDWAGGGGFHLTLAELVDEIRAHSGEQVVQLNHPRFPMGAIGLLKADVLTGQSFADREILRMPPADPNPESGDTGLWTDDIDALEVLNGFSTGNFWSGFRWWLTMIGRGLPVTATAVSDTHGIYGSLGASPRSFVIVDEGKDSPTTMDLAHFVEQIKQGALVGTNGPMIRVRVENDQGDQAGLGQTLDASSGEVSAQVTLEMPEWMTVNTLDVYTNVALEDLEGAPGEAIGEAVPPSQTIDLSWGEEHRHLVASGESDHYRKRQVLEVPLAVDGDSYVVFVARAQGGPTMRPVVSSAGRPLAYTNAVYLDFDGNGYDSPPLIEARQQRLEQSEQNRIQELAADRVIIERGDEITRENMGELIEALNCKHGDHTGHDDHRFHDLGLRQPHEGDGHDHGSGGHHHGPGQHSHSH